jgi:hypothetical protein
LHGNLPFGAMIVNHASLQFQITEQLEFNFYPWQGFFGIFNKSGNGLFQIQMTDMRCRNSGIREFGIKSDNLKGFMRFIDECMRACIKVRRKVL